MKFKNVYLNDYYTIVGPLEKNSHLKRLDMVMDDYYIGEKTFEQAEVKMQQIVIDNIIGKNNLNISGIDLLVGGDLTNQIAISNYSAKNYNIPFLGLYSACATFVESLIVASSMVDSGKLKKVIGITSSHNLTAERQFRYPIEYGAPRFKRSTMTATGSVGVILAHEGKIKINSATIGSSVNYGITDVNNMGAVMVPAAAETLMKHLKDLKISADYYDLILTGDLGRTGSKLSLEILKKNNLNLTNYQDAGSILFKEKDFENSGSSGPVTLPLVVFNKIIQNKKYKNILLLATGALHSPTLVNQHEEIPAISHAVSLEVL